LALQTARIPPPFPERVAHVLFTLESYTAMPNPADLDQLDELAAIQGVVNRSGDFAASSRRPLR
jgi:hypothetical protein